MDGTQLPLDIVAALTEAAREINAAPDLDSTLDSIVCTAARSLPGIDHVGISLVTRGGDIETRCGTDDLVWVLDRLQYEVGEGPCLDAIATEQVVIVNHLRHEQRWPKFVPRAVDHGLRAQMGLRLFVDGDTMGGLNLYATSTDTIDPDVWHLAELFAAHASLALGHARQETQLHAAIATRTVIGQAIGIVMERFGVDEERAFGYLRRVSSHNNVKLREVAATLVQQVNGSPDRTMTDPRPQ